MIYCDHNAGSPCRPEAAEAALRVLATGGNPSSIHVAGRRARAAMEDAREAVAGATGARAENVVFTSGATEALHLALEASRGEARSLVLSAIEHDALFAQAPNVWPDARIAPATGDGLIDLAALARLLDAAAKPALVAIMLVNNETGLIQPISDVSRLVREAGGMLLVDAAQALGRVEVDIASLDATYVALSSHKIGGPPGAGALALAPGAPFAATRGGGGQERGRRPGTENVPAIAGFGVAATIAATSWKDESARLAALRDRFEREADVSVIAQDAPRVGNTSLFTLAGVKASAAVIALDLAGVCVSAGAACSSGKVKKSRVLEAMGLPSEVQEGGVRASFGWNSTEADVGALVAAVRVLARRKAEAA
ncbi:MAG: aminotransferase class V-fold PLP-dependent enzyme [Hyphomonadaceae bacterium]|nr:aminotransferase class V-fold PLP-dependent enzyme [Hyphomonadaceae bacterium]